MTEQTGINRRPSSTGSPIDRSDRFNSNTDGYGGHYNQTNTGGSGGIYTGGNGVFYNQTNSTAFEGLRKVPELVLGRVVTRTNGIDPSSQYSRVHIETFTKLGVNYAVWTTRRRKRRKTERRSLGRKIQKKKKNNDAGGSGNNNNPDTSNNKRNPSMFPGIIAPNIWPAFIHLKSISCEN